MPKKPKPPEVPVVLTDHEFHSREALGLALRGSCKAPSRTTPGVEYTLTWAIEPLSESPPIVVLGTTCQCPAGGYAAKCGHQKALAGYIEMMFGYEIMAHKVGPPSAHGAEEAIRP